MHVITRGSSGVRLGSYYRLRTLLLSYFIYESSLVPTGGQTDGRMNWQTNGWTDERINYQIEDWRSEQTEQIMVKDVVRGTATPWHSLIPQVQLMNRWMDERTNGEMFIQTSKPTSKNRTRPRWSTMRPQATFSFSFFYNLFIFSLSSSLLLAPSSSLLLPPRPSFFLVQYYLIHLESIKGHFSSILTKALPTDGPTDGPTDHGQGWLLRTPSGKPGVQNKWRIVGKSFWQD